MKLTQSEIEKAYDDILEYLEERRDMPIDGILNGINKYHKDRFKIIKELKSKGLIKEHVTDRKSPFGTGLGNPPLIEKEYTYSISPEGRELVRKGGFKRKSWVNIASNWERVVILLLLVVSTFFGIPYFSTERNATPENNTKQQEEQSLSKPDTLVNKLTDKETDTTP
jgi:hypothetical protein